MVLNVTTAFRRMVSKCECTCMDIIRDPDQLHIYRELTNILHINMGQARSSHCHGFYSILQIDELSKKGLN